jgi:hypothetical protein
MDERGFSSKNKEEKGMGVITMSCTEAAVMVVDRIPLQVQRDGDTHTGVISMAHYITMIFLKTSQQRGDMMNMCFSVKNR